jgi:hypothetical protein
MVGVCDFDFENGILVSRAEGIPDLSQPFVLNRFKLYLQLKPYSVLRYTSHPQNPFHAMSYLERPFCIYLCLTLTSVNFIPEEIHVIATRLATLCII